LNLSGVDNLSLSEALLVTILIFGNGYNFSGEGVRGTEEFY
jgi:hypothetical protein